jgi:hypothetical protein
MLHDFASMDAACIAAFGRGIVYLPKAGGQIAVQGIYQREAEPEETSPGVYAVLFVRQADLPSPPARGDEVEIGTERYSVFDIDADAEGGAVLRLRRVD